MTESNDDYRLVNPVLRQIMKEVYNRRESYPIRYLCDVRLECVEDQSFTQLFFMSRGCSHDIQGGCTMCNYGYGKEYCLDHDAVLKSIAEKVKELPSHLQEIVVSPIGSFLDETEVPNERFLKILDLLSAVECNEFTCETRADSVSAEKLQILKEKIYTDHISLELGIESTNNWLLRNCINKNASFEIMQKAIHTAHNTGFGVCANVGIGFPFVNEAVSIASAVTSIRQMLKNNVQCVALFAYNIRPGTLLAMLWNNGLYGCTSLWALVEVLSYFNDAELRKIQISWYRNYYADRSKILQMPYLCDECQEDVLMLLDAYRNHPCRSSLEPLLAYNCSCKKKWYEQYHKQSCSIDFETVQRLYTFLANTFSISDTVLKHELCYMEQTLSEKGYLTCIFHG